MYKKWLANPKDEALIATEIGMLRAMETRRLHLPDPTAELQRECDAEIEESTQTEKEENMMKAMRLTMSQKAISMTMRVMTQRTSRLKTTMVTMTTLPLPPKGKQTVRAASHWSQFQTTTHSQKMRV